MLYEWLQTCFDFVSSTNQPECFEHFQKWVAELARMDRNAARMLRMQFQCASNQSERTSIFHSLYIRAESALV